MTGTFAERRWRRWVIGALLGFAIHAWGNPPAPVRADDTAVPLIGVLQPEGSRAAAYRAAGLRLATLELAWNRYEPRAGRFDEEYVREIRRRREQLTKAGLEVVLDLGMQYPPGWALRMANGRYVNQYGQSYDEDARPGAGGLNAIFNQSVRDRQAEYVRRVFDDLGTGFFAVRLGWCYYGELHYPRTKYGDHDNCYWGFDALAQGQAPGLPPGIAACPVPGWKPGDSSAGHESARAFVNWYLGAIRNYHDWQIATTRRSFGGRLAMLYPSWGIRPGQLEAAISVDLNGSTSAEKNGEVQRGYDFAAMIEGIHDPRVVVYTTWLDANPRFGDDDGNDPRGWSPAHYLTSLAAANPHRVSVWGENTGPGDRGALAICVARMKRYGMLGFMWAFAPNLFDGDPGHATLAEMSEAISAPRPIKPPPPTPQ